MAGYIGPETMFMLSLTPDQREYVSDIVEESLQMRSEGMSEEEISSQLDEAIRIIESWTKTPRIVRRIVMGTYAAA
jgi:hypothetical protein